MPRISRYEQANRLLELKKLLQAHPEGLDAKTIGYLLCWPKNTTLDRLALLESFGEVGQLPPQPPPVLQVSKRWVVKTP